MFYILKNDEQLGPYSQLQLKAMWANGSITANILCWREGMTDWMPVEAVLEESVPTSDSNEVLKTEAIASEGLLLADKALIPSGAIRRALAFVIDYVAIVALAFNVPTWIGYEKDPEATVTSSLVLVICVIMKDFPFRGRSLGRLLTGSYLIDLANSQTATFSKSALRNAAQALWLFGVFPLLLLLEWIFQGTKSDTIKILIAVGSMAMPVMILVYLITLARSFNNQTGQGVWDVPFGTCVMSKK